MDYDIVFIFKMFRACKHHWSDKKLRVLLEAGPASLNQIDEASGRILCSYDYKDIEGLALVSLLRRPTSE